MRHQNKGRELGRERNQRKALFRTMLGSLIMREKIETTEAKAKELKGKIDRLINKAKKGKDPERKLAIIRDLKKYIPAMAMKKLTGEFLDKFEKRSSGYTRIIKLAPRKSDSARIAIIEFVY
jgi:large subunit ribosomal protein L17